MYSCVPRGAGDVPVEAVVEDPLACGSLSRSPRPTRRTSSSCRASAPTARRGPSTGEPARVVRQSSGQPSASASRLAGSIVTTPPAARRGLPPARARPQSWSCRPHRSRSRRRPTPVDHVDELGHRESLRGARSRRPRAERRRVVGAELADEQERQEAAAAAAAPSPAVRAARSCSSPAGAAERRGRPQHRGRPAATPRRSTAAWIGHRSSVAPVDAVDDDRPEAHADPILEAVGGLDELVDRRLLGQRHEHHLAAGGIGQQLERRRRLGVDRPDPHGVEQPARREQEA